MNINDIVVLAIGFFLVGILAPIALNELYGANTTGWNNTVITIFQTLLPVLFVIGVAIRFIPRIRGET